MALSFRLPTPTVGRDVPRSLVIAVEVVGALSGIGAIVMLSSNTILLVVLGALFICSAAMSLVLSRPSLLVDIAIITMWFDSVGAGPVRTGRVIAALTIAMMIARVMTSQWRPPKLQVRAWIGPAAFFSWALLSGLWSSSSGAWMTGIAELTLGAIYAMIVLCFLDNEEQLSRAMKSWVWTGVPIAILSYYLYNMIESNQEDPGEENRIVGFTGNANAYAALLALAVSVAFLFARRAQTRFERSAYYATMLLFMAALLTTGSRAGILQLVVTLMYIAVTMPGLERRQRVRTTVGGGVFVVIGMVIAAWYNPERYSVLGFFGDAGAGRVELWNAATNSIGEKPIFGWSIGSFRTQMLDALSAAPGGSLEITRPLLNRASGGIEVHNTYLTILLDLGVVGLVVFALMTALVLKNLYDLRGSKWWDWAWVLIGAQFNLLVGSFFGSVYNQKFQWMIIGVSGVAYTYARNTTKAERLRTHTGVGTGRAGVLALGGPGRPFEGDRALAAKTDLRLRYPLRWVVLAAVLVGAVFGGGAAKAFGTGHYSAYTRVAILEIDSAEPAKALEVSDDRIQFVLNMARSVPYLAEVKRQSGVDVPIEELAELITPTRANFGAIVRITVRTSDEALTRRLGLVLQSSLDTVVEQVRAGTIVVVENGARQVAPETAGYDGPLYLTPYKDVVESSSAPRVALCAFIGGGFGMLAVFVYAMLAQTRRRVTTEEDVDELVGLPFVAAVPRPIFAREHHVERYYSTAGDLIDAACPVDPRVVGLCSPGLGGLQRRVSKWTALGLANVLDRPVVFVDLAEPSGPLSRVRRRGAGLYEVASGTATIAQVTGTVRARIVPQALARLVRGARRPVSIIGLGGRGEDPLAISAAAPVMAELLDRLADDALVVVNLPEVPGPLSVSPVLTLCDAVLVQLLDGWSPLDDTDLTVDAASAIAGNRVGYLLISQ